MLMTQLWCLVRRWKWEQADERKMAAVEISQSARDGGAAVNKIKECVNDTK